MEFQLTASRRGWQQVVEQIHVVSDISTHSLTKRLTRWLSLHYRQCCHFNSQPHEEADFGVYISTPGRIISTHSLTKRLTSGDYFKWVTLAISTHSLTKRLTNRNPETYCSKIFQLTASRRGWLSFSEYFWLTRIFQLTASRRGWPAKNDGEHTLDAFQLTASRRGWPWCRTLKRTQMYFNSQPHEEADSRHSLRCGVELFQLTASRRGWRHRRCTVKLYGTISTHSLTKRLTRDGYWTEITVPISTHSLTKRLTATALKEAFASSFQLTASRRGWPNGVFLSTGFLHFNSQPHEEADWFDLIVLDIILISTHSLTKRLTAILDKNTFI